MCVCVCVCVHASALAPMYSEVAGRNLALASPLASSGLLAIFGIPWFVVQSF